ncbi:hypothetical protein HELRODRAFT_189432 [Helobdella robusta]|uniref:BACK domain-containing protein n=1 Tax=Helobdella robusta TaxID=6412 RepID=T1FR19_HELRO|nr:hypothetical protein HELRODRAFT_189432 [Helobdella robusta]ESN94559.1 hypothetical protein HELRODRAFT_189432 [Helobdella robusta]
MLETADAQTEKVDSSAGQQTIILISQKGGRYEIDKKTFSQISGYYRSLVNSGMRDAASNELDLKELSNRCLAEVNPGIYYKNSANHATTGFNKLICSENFFAEIKECYSQLKIKGKTLKLLKNIEEGLKGASFLQINSMIDHYSALLLKHLNVQTCLRILLFANKYSLDKALETVLDYWLNNFKFVAGGSTLLPLNVIDRLAKADVVNSDSEFDIFSYIINCLSVDNSMRCHAEKLLSEVRYHLMTASSKQICRDRLRVLNVNHININQDYANSSRSVGVLLSLGVASEKRVPDFFHSLSVYDLVSMTCKKRRSQGCVSRSLVKFRSCRMPGPPLEWLRYQACILNDSLYLAGKLNEEAFFSNQVYVYDLIKSTWRQCCNMHAARALFYFDKIAGHLYAVSGQFTKIHRTHVVEKYFPDKDKWYLLASLPVAVSSLTGCVFRGMMYVSGGDDGARFLTNVYRYDPYGGRWECRTPLLTARCCHIMTYVGNKLIVLGGKVVDQLHRREYAMDGEIYEFETDQWTSVLRLIKPVVYSPSVLVNSCLYIFKNHTSLFVKQNRNVIQKINLTKFLNEGETSALTVEKRMDVDNNDDDVDEKEEGECQLYEYCIENFGSPMTHLCLYFK